MKQSRRNRVSSVGGWIRRCHLCRRNSTSGPGRDTVTPLEARALLYRRFNENVIDAIELYVVAVKPNSAFYEVLGHFGIWTLGNTIAYARSRGLLVILDAKRGDGGDTAQAYAEAYLNPDSPLAVDALTIQPWIGSACLDYFLEAVKKFGKGVFVVDKTSFVPNSEIEQMWHTTGFDSGLPVWQAVARIINAKGEGTEGQRGYRNFGAVVGATYPEEASLARQLMPWTWF